MPTYAYRCPEGHEFERVQKISAPAGASCPRCGRAAERIITGGAGLVFKGSGFYITDYKRAGTKPGEGKEPKVKDAGAGEKGGEKSSSRASESAGKRASKKRDTGATDS